MKQVEGKTALITGGASGIGFGMAQAFLAAGMNVVIADVRQEALDEAGERLSGCNRPYHLLKVDVTDRAAMAQAALEVQTVFGNLHLLCNNAGLNGATPIDDVGYEEWDWLVGINLNGVMNGIVTFLPGMKAHGEGGHIVNTSSMAGILPLPSPGGTYSALKFAVRGLSDSLRLALAHQNIGVSVLCPGLVRTNIRGSVAALMPGSVAAKVHAVEDDPMNGEFTPENAGMDPRIVGDRVLEGVRNNDAYILPHGEFLGEVRERFEAILEAFPRDQAIDAGREYYESRRREATRQATMAAADIGGGA